MTGVDLAQFNILSGALVQQGIEAVQAGLSYLKIGDNGIDGFVFDIRMNETVSNTSQITDHYTEDNTTIQDHVAFEPVKVTLVGKVGELVFTTNKALEFARITADRLVTLGELSPVQRDKATQQISDAYQIEAALRSSVNLLLNLGGTIGLDATSWWSDVQCAKDNQSRAFLRFQNIFYSRKMITVVTPWRNYHDMMIESFTVDQDETSVLESTFTINLKQIRKVSTTTNTGQLEGRLKQQAAPVKNSGTVKGPKNSVAAQIFPELSSPAVQ